MKKGSEDIKRVTIQGMLEDDMLEGVNGGLSEMAYGMEYGITGRGISGLAMENNVIVFPSEGTRSIRG